MNPHTIKNKFIPFLGINEKYTGFCKNCCNNLKDSLAWCDHCISSKCINNYSLFFNKNPINLTELPVKGVGLVALENEQKQGVHYSKEELELYATEDRNKTVESQLNNEDIYKRLEYKMCHPSKLNVKIVKKIRVYVWNTKTLIFLTILTIFTFYTPNWWYI